MLLNKSWKGGGLGGPLCSGFTTYDKNFETCRRTLCAHAAESIRILIFGLIEALIFSSSDDFIIFVSIWQNDQNIFLE